MASYTQKVEGAALRPGQGPQRSAPGLRTRTGKTHPSERGDPSHLASLFVGWIPGGFALLSPGLKAIGLGLLLLGFGACKSGPLSGGVGEDRVGANLGPSYAAFEAASQESGVPTPLLLAVSYEATRFWVEPTQAVLGYEAGPELPARLGLLGLDAASQEAAAAQLGVPLEALRKAPAAELLRAGALTLAAAARALQAEDGGPRTELFLANPRDQSLKARQAFVAAWRPVLARWSGYSSGLATDYADSVLAFLEVGAGRMRPDGEVLELEGLFSLDELQAMGLSEVGETTLTTATGGSATLGRGRQFLTASSSLVNQVRSADRSNYVVGRSQNVDRIIIHVTQGSYSSAIGWFQNPSSNVSAHYVVRSSDGYITQMVDEANTAWHVGAYNSRSIGVEHEGFVSDPAWFTDAMYRASARLVCDIATRNGIPVDRQHIIGHVQVPGASHTDPGAYWDWSKYMGLVNAACVTTSGSGGSGGSGGSTGGGSGGSTGGGSGGSTGGGSGGSTGGGSGGGGCAGHAGSEGVLLQGVVLVDGVGLAGATVRAGGSDVKTDATGSYGLLVPTGLLRIEASAPGHGGTAIRRQLTRNGAWGTLRLP